MSAEDGITRGGGAQEESAMRRESVHRRALERELSGHLRRVRTLLVRLLNAQPKEEVQRILEGMLTQLPKDSPVDELDAEKYAEEYDRAEQELRQEREQFLGFSDVVKGLLMWVETPEERLRKNLR
jgi:hypothetical protein